MISNFISRHDFNNINYLVIKARKRGTNNVVASLHSEPVDFRNSSGSFATFAAIRLVSSLVSSFDWVACHYQRDGVAPNKMVTYCPGPLDDWLLGNERGQHH
jgi:hypothetical protein